MGFDPVTAAIGVAGNMLASGQKNSQSEREHAWNKEILKLQQDFTRSMTRPLDFNQMIDLGMGEFNKRGLWDSGIALDWLKDLYKDYGITPEGTAPGVVMPPEEAPAPEPVSSVPFTRNRWDWRQNPLRESLRERATQTAALQSPVTVGTAQTAAMPSPAMATPSMPTAQMPSFTRPATQSSAFAYGNMHAPQAMPTTIPTFSRGMARPGRNRRLGVQ